MTAPLVGVTGPTRRGFTGWSCSWLALKRSGARARRLRAPFYAEQLHGLSGVVIGGGTLIEPSRYEQGALEEYAYDVARDELEWSVLTGVMARRLPVLGICRGAQMLNVYCGGTLWQDLVADMPGLTLRQTVLASKRVMLEPISAVANVMGVLEVQVNSLHRQGINRVGRGLRVAARDADGIVQAIESTHEPAQFAIGVQWHPEYLPLRPTHQRLFSALVEAARRVEAFKA